MSFRRQILMAVALGAIGLVGCDRKAPAATAPGAATPERGPGPRPGAGGGASEVAATATHAAKGDAGDKSISPLPVQVARYELRMDAAQLRALEANPNSDETRPATFVADGEIYENVQVRFRGEWARTWPKKPLKIFFARDRPFHGHHSVNLNSAWRDASFVRETLGYHVFARCGAPASRSRMVHLDLNGEFRGLYVEVEQVDKTLLKRHGLKGASLFKATSDDNGADERDYGTEARLAAHYENETEKSDGVGELQRFCHDLATATDVPAFFEQRMELEQFINYLAATVLIQHWDGYNKNHFIIFDRGLEKWQVWPWDLDRTLGDHWNNTFDRVDLPLNLGTRAAPSVTGWNRLQDRFFEVPALRARFYKRLAELLETEFTPDKLNPILDKLESALADDAALDRKRWGGPRGGLHAGIAGVKTFIERRRAFLQAELKKVQ